MSPGAFEIDFDQLYFAGDLNNRRLTINEYPSLQLVSRSEALNQAVEAVYKGDSSELIPALFETYNSNLHKAVSGVDPESAKLLKNNLTRMAAAKANYTAQLLQRARADKNGVIRPKSVYQKEAKKIISRANTTQAAEYNAAVHRTRIFKQMNRFQETKRLFPNIEWLRTRSASPREVHLAYVGRVWPMDDPFLQTNHPGCVWGCKCDWKNTDKPATDNQDLKPVPASPGLEGNPASTNEIFTNKHPYFKRVDKHIPDLGVLNNPDELVFLKQKDANGKPFLMHYNNQNDNELQKNLKAV
ncbi:MAG: phage minor head protein, partial [Bacteroidales bacterium]